MCYHAVRGRLNANQRTAEIDHKLKIGHRDALNNLIIILFSQICLNQHLRLLIA